jgi:hypothetical protein
MFSLIRITRKLQSNRVLYAFAGLFLVTWLVLTAQVFWVCETKPAWKNDPVPQCGLGVAVGICQIVSEYIILK